ncbi:MAG: elongation factor G [Rhodospirillales bacterium]|nr:elongation factor G [Rhodospirillales bacterium]
MNTHIQSGPRVAAIVGTYLSGKTTLLESLLVASGTLHRKGTVKEGNSTGDSSQEARARNMSTELNLAHATYLDEEWTFIDCPGSVELSQDSLNALMISDTVIVVTEATPDKVVAVAPILKALDDYDIPHMIFINKMDHPDLSVRATLESLQNLSSHPLVLREIPIREGEKITGFVDLVSERAFRWQEGKPSDLISLPDSVTDREQEARTGMLESLADYDDHLLEELLEDVVPSSSEVYENMTKDIQQNLIVPVFFGSAEHDNGIHRLLKALRHETTGVEAVIQRLGISGKSTSAQVFKAFHAGQIGKLSIARILQGDISDGMTLNGERVSGVYHMNGAKQDKVAKALAGDVVALGRMDNAKIGDLLSESGNEKSEFWPDPLAPLFSIAIHAKERSDEVKLTSALAKVIEEDPSLSYGNDENTGELLLWGQGEIHLNIAADRLQNRFHLSVTTDRPQVPYKETIRKPGKQHARHRKQSGGHGEFGDVHIEIKPLPRGTGFDFADTITGGVVPKQYIPAVETGVREYLVRGPLGFQIVDLAVTLTDGQHHNVDSSEMAFKKAAQQAMRDCMPNCAPVLLEPICIVVVSMPNAFTSHIQRLVSGRRGQILGFMAKDGWEGWDEVQANIPQSEMHDMIIELRSITQGVGTFQWSFDHLQELDGKQADDVVAKRAESNI